VVVLKARQLGLSWEALGYGLQRLTLHPVAQILLFSRRDDEATDLLERLKQMHQRLPDWLQCGIEIDNDHELKFANGSRAMAFPCTAGDSYTASLVIVDEADLIPDLGRLMRQVKPTVDGGGQILVISRADKAQPESAFKKIYRAASSDSNSEWKAVFLPWNARPDRDQAWYNSKAEDSFARTGSYDELHEQYPATEAEALAPRELDKRFPPSWICQCYTPMRPIERFRAAPGDPAHKWPAIPGLTVFRLPIPGRRYCVGADPAEGNPTSDDSAAEFADLETGEEVAALSGHFEPATFAAHVAQVAAWFNHAVVLVERNNHGHAVLLWLRDNAPHLRLLTGQDLAIGWAQSSKSKAILYAAAAEDFRDGEAAIHDLQTFAQLCSIEGSTLKAPPGQNDDRAVAYVLALLARSKLLRVQVGHSPDFGVVQLTPAYGETQAGPFGVGVGPGGRRTGAIGGCEHPLDWGLLMKDQDLFR